LTHQTSTFYNVLQTKTSVISASSLRN